MTGGSALYAGSVMHNRLRPARHKLAYRLFMVLLDLDELDRTAARLRLFSLRGFNLFSLRQADYADGGPEPLRGRIARQLADAGLAGCSDRILLLTMPRMLGFAFNPISVYFCYRPHGALGAVLYEVNNTFGERHSYLLPVTETNGRTIRQSVPKQLHVSPFMGMDMDYAFRVLPPGDALGIAITGSDAQGPLISAVLNARRQPLSDAALLHAIVAMPLMTLKVVAGIGWEALKLWLKRVPVWRKPAAPAVPVTLGHG